LTVVLQASAEARPPFIDEGEKTSPGSTFVRAVVTAAADRCRPGSRWRHRSLVTSPDDVISCSIHFRSFQFLIKRTVLPGSTSVRADSSESIHTRIIAADFILATPCHASPPEIGIGH